MMVRLGPIDLLVIDEHALLVWASSGLVIRRWRVAQA